MASDSFKIIYMLLDPCSSQNFMQYKYIYYIYKLTVFRFIWSTLFYGNFLFTITFKFTIFPYTDASFLYIFYFFLFYENMNEKRPTTEETNFPSVSYTNIACLQKIWNIAQFKVLWTFMVLFCHYWLDMFNIQ